MKYIAIVKYILKAYMSWLKWGVLLACFIGEILKKNTK